MIKNIVVTLLLVLIMFTALVYAEEIKLEDNASTETDTIEWETKADVTIELTSVLFHGYNFSCRGNTLIMEKTNDKMP